MLYEMYEEMKVGYTMISSETANGISKVTSGDVENCVMLRSVWCCLFVSTLDAMTGAWVFQIRDH